jgi:hypothetical protein
MDGSQINMLVIPQFAIAHVLAAQEQELARLTAIELEFGDHWPQDFDANDIWLYEIILEALKAARSENREIIDISGKPLWFLLMVLPDYVSRHLPEMTLDEYQGLKRVYDQHVAEPTKPFPEWG